MYEIFLEVVWFVESLGYFGIFIMTFIESTFIPIPAEITLIPAGYLVHKGEMNFILVVLISTIGTLAGSAVNYYIAYFFGRKLFANKGKYFFMNESKLKKIEKFFANHGAISVFTGRFLPGIKHFISFPAGLAKMDIKLFTIYTIAGSTIWTAILAVLGYEIGENHQLIAQYTKEIIGIIFGICSLILTYFFFIKKNKITNQ